MCEPNVVDSHEYIDVPDEILVDESYTVSYYFGTKSWFSFHDYIPDYSFSLRDNRVLSFKDNVLYYHNQEGIYGKFYDKIHECYITPCFSPLIKESDEQRRLPFSLHNINFEVDIIDANKKRLLNKTMSSISVHNSYQSTIKTELIPYDNTCSHISQYRVYNIKRVKNHWEFNRFKDNLLDKNNVGHIELIDDFLDVNVLNTFCEWNKNPNRKRFIDNFDIIKLTYNNKEQFMMCFYEMNFTYSIVKL